MAAHSSVGLLNKLHLVVVARGCSWIRLQVLEAVVADRDLWSKALDLCPTVLPVRVFRGCLALTPVA